MGRRQTESQRSYQERRFVLMCSLSACCGSSDGIVYETAMCRVEQQSGSVRRSDTRKKPRHRLADEVIFRIDTSANENRHTRRVLERAATSRSEMRPQAALRREQACAPGASKLEVDLDADLEESGSQHRGRREPRLRSRRGGRVERLLYVRIAAEFVTL